MSMLISELQMLAGDWRSWVVVALMAAVAAQSLAVYFFCPFAHGRAPISDEDVAEARSQGFRPGARFAFVMLSGILLATTGLFMIAEGVHPALALVALVVGVVVMQTEPSRNRIREQRRQVALHRDSSAETVEHVRSRLRISQRELAMMNIGLALALAIGLAVFR